MKQLELFFDYACPFCERAHRGLQELVAEFKKVQIVWRPCEAHPRPDRYGPHSDLLIRGMYWAREQGVDLWEYHRRAYHAAVVEQADIEDPQALPGIFAGLLDGDKLLAALESGAYLPELQAGNDYAYGKMGVWAVPAYRLTGQKLDAVENVGVSAAQLKQFLRENTEV